MAPSAVTQVLLSPAELSYLYTSLCNNPPLRPDGRSATEFRLVVAEKDVLPSTNGSSRVCFADGTEAVVGIKAEVAKSRVGVGKVEEDMKEIEGQAEVENDGGEESSSSKAKGKNIWIDLVIRIPGFREDDALPIFMSSILTEALLANGALQSRLWINKKFHWKLFIDVLLFSAPLSYPLQLLSITTYLALLSTRLPALVSETEEDSLFNDDWDASTFLYPKKDKAKIGSLTVTLVVIVVGDNIIVDPAKEELAVANAVIAASIANANDGSGYQIVSLRTIDPPSRLTPPGVPNSLNNALRDDVLARELVGNEVVWNPPRGGLKRSKISEIMALLLKPNGIVKDILSGLDKVAW